MKKAGKEAGKKAGMMLKKEVKAGKKEGKIEKVMKEYKEGKLHSGSKRDPKLRIENKLLL